MAFGIPDAQRKAHHSRLRDRFHEHGRNPKASRQGTKKFLTALSSTATATRPTISKTSAARRAACSCPSAATKARASRSSPKCSAGCYPAMAQGKQWWNNGGHGVNGVFLQAFAVEEFQPLESFYDKVDEFIEFIKSSPRAPGFSEILLPGESGRRREAAQLEKRRRARRRDLVRTHGARRRAWRDGEYQQPFDLSNE